MVDWWQSRVFVSGDIWHHGGLTLWWCHLSARTSLMPVMDWMIVHGVSSVIWWSKKGICIGRSGQSETLNCAKNAQNLNISIKNLVMETRTFRKISAAFCTHKVGFSDESLSEAEHHQMGHMTTSLQRRWGSMGRYWTFSKGWDFTKNMGCCRTIVGENYGENLFNFSTITYCIWHYINYPTLKSA